MISGAAIEAVVSCKPRCPASPSAVPVAISTTTTVANTGCSPRRQSHSRPTIRAKASGKR
jgi:hypothetical protein